MVILVDTNVILDYLAEREGFFEDARKIMEVCANGEMLKQVCTLLSVVSAEHDEVVKAVEAAEFKDFEDCLQDRCAVMAKADYIVARNVADYKYADTQVIIPSEFCKLVAM